MKNNILIITCLFFYLSISAQDYYRYPTYVDNSRNLLEWGDQNYQQNLRGLKSLMTDLQEIDPDLYDQLEPNFALLLKKNKEANIILGVGSGSTLILMIAGVIKASSSTAPTFSGVPGQRQQLKQNDFEKGMGLILAGGLVGVLSSAIYFKKKVKQNDILDFTNRFNRHSKGDKIELTLHPEIGIGNGGSVGVALRFIF